MLPLGVILHTTPCSAHVDYVLLRCSILEPYCPPALAIEPSAGVRASGRRRKKRRAAVVRTRDGVGRRQGANPSAGGHGAGQPGVPRPGDRCVQRRQRPQAAPSIRKGRLWTVFICMHLKCMRMYVDSEKLGLPPPPLADSSRGCGTPLFGGPQMLARVIIFFRVAQQNLRAYVKTLVTPSS